ncbi:MAG: hypothetical protein Q4G39_03090 [Brachymonas sp.]|nr:hypothetical protein [Brachymonas sp.]
MLHFQPANSLQRKLAACTLMALAAGATGSAMASSPDAWKQTETEIRQACTKASTLKQVKPAGAILHFPDGNNAVSALLLQGRYPQPHMRNKPGKELCLFNRTTRSAVVSEADNIAKVPVVRKGK